MPHCVVPLCHNKSSNTLSWNRVKSASIKDTEPVSFHQLPADKKVRKLWLSGISRPTKNLPADIHVCSAHFTADSFDDSTRVKMSMRFPHTPFLNPGAVPTIFPYKQQHQENKPRQSSVKQAQKRKVKMHIRELVPTDRNPNPISVCPSARRPPRKHLVSETAVKTRRFTNHYAEKDYAKECDNLEEDQGNGTMPSCSYTSVMNATKKSDAPKSRKKLTDTEDAEATSDAEFSTLLHPVKLKECVEYWLKEDTSGFDYGGYVVKDKEETAFLFCKSEGVLAGCPFFNAVFHVLGCEVEWDYPEGMDFSQANGFAEFPIKIATVTGSARQLLLGERVALNCITRACGIATVARYVAGKKQAADWHGEIAGTRKTTPGFRIVEKYALLVGGASTHRYDLSSMVMLKDNHIWSAESIEEAVKMSRKACGFSLKIEVECQNLLEAMAAAEAGCDIVMLDNMMPKDLHYAAEAFKAQHPNCLVEASGGVTAENIEDYMGPHVDVISLGALTQGYQCVDLSLKVQQDIRR